MKVTLESTPEFVTMDNSSRARVWRGTSENGVAVVALISGVAVDTDADASEFERELIETTPPSVITTTDQLRHLARRFADLFEATKRTLMCTSLAETRATRGALRNLCERLESLYEICRVERDADSGGVPRGVTSAIVNHPRVDEAPTTAAGAAFIADAMRGATMAWHAREKHPGQVEDVARLAAPPDEPHRSSWLIGFRLAADAPEAPRAAPSDDAPSHDGPGEASPERASARERLERLGLDLDAMNDGRAALGMSRLTPEAALASIEDARRAASFVEGGPMPPRCRVCGCTDFDCSRCVARTGKRCTWVRRGVTRDEATGFTRRDDLCSACADLAVSDEASNARGLS